MKHSIIIGIALAAFATPALAETPAQNPTQSAQDSTAPATGNMRHMNGKMHDRMQNRMDYMWKEMDTNNDGVITREESTAFGNKKFDEKDANHDGKVTKEEWEAFHNAKMEKMKEMRSKGGMHGGNAAPAAPADSKK
jgi:hypothetical protein